MRKISQCIRVAFLAGWVCSAVAAPPAVRLYLDADQTGSRASGISIERGIRTALSEVGNRMAGYDIELLVRDHHGNSRRSKKHLNEYLADDQALAVFCGLHSPPVLAHLEFINQQGILLLDPWAAAGPITRYPSATNWVFRLSIDDTKAGAVITDYAVNKRGFKNPALLLEETGWGKSNQRTMQEALGKLNISPIKTKWFNWGLGENHARILLREIADAGADVVFLVANAPEGKVIARAMVSLPPEKRLPICSHWGITGGDFCEVVDAEMRAQLDLSFIQTSFSFVSHPDHPLGRQVLARAGRLFPNEIREAKDISAPTGFIHAYDLTRLLISAVEQAGLTGDLQQDRKCIRRALEQLDNPVEGLIQTYRKPFGLSGSDSPDAHEALCIENFVMAGYGADGEIILKQDTK